jgi:hypothetical protein
MEHVQHLHSNWMRTPDARERQRQTPPAAQPIERARIRKLAELHHRQLVQAKRRFGTNDQMLRAQAEELRQLTIAMPEADANAFMNIYTEESSAVERQWQAKQRGHAAREPLNPTLVTMLTFLATILAVAAAIYYAI